MSRKSVDATGPSGGRPGLGLIDVLFGAGGAGRRLPAPASPPPAGEVAQLRAEVAALQRAQDMLGRAVSGLATITVGELRALIENAVNGLRDHLDCEEGYAVERYVETLNARKWPLGSLAAAFLFASESREIEPAPGDPDCYRLRAEVRKAREEKRDQERRQTADEAQRRTRTRNESRAAFVDHARELRRRLHGEDKIRACEAMGFEDPDAFDRSGLMFSLGGGPHVKCCYCGAAVAAAIPAGKKARLALEHKEGCVLAAAKRS